MDGRFKPMIFPNSVPPTIPGKDSDQMPPAFPISQANNQGSQPPKPLPPPTLPVHTELPLQTETPTRESAGPMLFPSGKPPEHSIEHQYDYIKTASTQSERDLEAKATRTFSVKDLETIQQFDDHYNHLHKLITQKYQQDIDQLASLEKKADLSYEEIEEERRKFRLTAIEYSKTLIKAYTEQHKLSLMPGLGDYWAKYQIEDMYAYSVLTDAIEDETITEIIGYRYDRFRIEREGLRTPLGIMFRSNSHMKDTIDRLIRKTGRALTDATPNVDARLPNKSRISASISPLIISGCEVTIRKFPKEPWKWENLLERNSVSNEVKTFIQAIVVNKLSLLVSGGTGAGKTTLLNIISNDMEIDEEVLVIENVHELNLNLPYVRYFEERLGENPIFMMQLLINALRKAPKAIVVGEVRGQEALTLIQALSTGHYGYGTGHSDSPEEMIYTRLNAMILQAGVNWETPVINRMICSAIPFIVQVSRMRDRTRKITHITELLGVDQQGAEKWGAVIGDRSLKHDPALYGTGYVYMHHIYKFQEDDQLDPSGKVTGSYIRSKYRPYHFNLLSRMGTLNQYWE